VPLPFVPPPPPPPPPSWRPPCACSLRDGAEIEHHYRCRVRVLFHDGYLHQQSSRHGVGGPRAAARIREQSHEQNVCAQLDRPPSAARIQLQRIARARTSRARHGFSLLYYRRAVFDTTLVFPRPLTSPLCCLVQVQQAAAAPKPAKAPDCAAVRRGFPCSTTARLLVQPSD
jgi:hypothetical protein